MMRLGAVILKVDARQVADTMWYFPLLEPYVDHVPVKADLSDLEEKIAWCRAHDEECKQIAANCLEKYNKFVARDGLLDYIEMMTKSIARRQVDAPAWYDPPPGEKPPPNLAPPTHKCMKKQDRFCFRCEQELEEERKAEKERKAMEAMQKKSVQDGIKARRERLLRKGREREEKRKAKELEKANAKKQRSG